MVCDHLDQALHKDVVLGPDLNQALKPQELLNG